MKGLGLISKAKQDEIAKDIKKKGEAFVYRSDGWIRDADKRAKVFFGISMD
jgi:hypothetical protein